MPPPAFPLRRTPSIPWRPLTDPEWDALAKILHRTGRGRPPADARALWNGIFWVACSREPWRAVPAEFGKPDTAHRALRRAAPRASAAATRSAVTASATPPPRAAPPRPVALTPPP